MSKARQRQYTKEVREHIIDISQRIISEEGLDAISVRRVANEMDYSAGIVYHYFHNKDHLLSCAVREGYRKILLSLKKPDSDLPPDEKLRISFKNFIDAAIRAPTAYKAFTLDFSSAVLGDNGCAGSPTFTRIVSYLEEGKRAGLFACSDPLLTAKVFWCAGYGLFFRLLIEPDILPEQRDALIQHQFDILLKGISV